MRLEALHELMEFGKFKLASGLIVKTTRQGSDYGTHIVRIKDPTAKTWIDIDDWRPSKGKGKGTTWNNVNIGSKGISTGKMRSKSQLQKKSASKLVRELARHAAHAQKKGRPLKVKNTHIVNKKLAKALERAHKSPRFKKAIGNIEVNKDYSRGGIAKVAAHESLIRSSNKRNRALRLREDRLGDRLTPKREYKHQNQRSKDNYYVNKKRRHPKAVAGRTLMKIKDKAKL